MNMLGDFLVKYPEPDCERQQEEHDDPPVNEQEFRQRILRAVGLIECERPLPLREPETHKLQVCEEVTYLITRRVV